MPALRTALCLVTISAFTATSIAAEKPCWVEPMKAVHAGFNGNPGYVAQFGDSITFSMAFWTPIGWDEPDAYLSKDDGLRSGKSTSTCLRRARLRPGEAA
jgi:hypothetical protein